MPGTFFSINQIHGVLMELLLCLAWSRPWITNMLKIKHVASRFVREKLGRGLGNVRAALRARGT